MADLNERELTPEEREELERRRREGRPTLDQEITERWSPERLSRLVVEGAGRGERMDLATRSEMERLHPGQDFSSVRVFRGALAEEVTRRHSADAVTIANTGMILVRESPRSAPGTTAHTALLAHELTHVAQAQRGMQFAKEGGGDDSEHEREAQHVEASAQASSRGGESDGADARRGEERKRLVRERVLELLEEERRMMADRSGTGWTG